MGYHIIGVVAAARAVKRQWTLPHTALPRGTPKAAAMTSPIPQAPSPGRWRGAPARRRGVASLLAMLFLVIFATLAIGFYAQTNINVQIAANERRSSDARLAAESGMAFMRYQLSLVGTQYLPENQMLTELANVLADRLNETANFSLYRLEVGMSASGDAILIPNDTNAVIPLGNGTGFRCKITRSGRQFIVKVAGRSSSGARAVPSDSGRGVEYSFDPRQIPAPLFDYGVASTGPITVDNKVSITGAPAALGSILSASQTNPALTLNGSASVSG